MIANTQIPLVSFIITTYNLPLEYLVECLKSILQLSLNSREREIILVDDGSDISPINDLAEYQDDIIYIRQRNQGLSIARNTGLQNASGKYIQFVDGDDCLIQVGYEHCLDLLRYHNPDIVHFTSSNKTFDKEVPYQYSEPISGSTYLYNNNLRAAAWCYTFKRDLLQQQRFTPGILHEDEEFTPILFLKAERIITTDTKAYYYRERKDSIMHKTEDKRHYLKRLADTEKVIFQLQEKSNYLSEPERIALNRRIAQLTMDYLYNTIVLAQNYKHLEKNIKRLHDKGLFPLPDKKYTKKYQIFAKAINNKITRKILFYTLLKLK